MNWLTPQTVLALLALLNVYVLWVLNRRTKANDEHRLEHKAIEAQLERLRGCSLTEERFRQILKEEFQVFELRLINEGRLEPQRRRSGEK